MRRKMMPIVVGICVMAILAGCVRKEISNDKITIKQYKGLEIRKELQVSKEAARESAIMDAVWETLAKNCVVKEYPKEQLEKTIEEVKRRYSFHAMLYGMDVDTYLEVSQIDVQKEAQAVLLKEYAVELIADKEKLTISKEQYEAKLKELANMHGYADLEQMETDYGKGNVEKELLEEMVGKFLIDNCVQVESKKTGK